MALATRCPHCDTVFRLDPHLLAPHDGRVRCGHCQEVFDAAHHQFELAEEAPAAVAATPSPTELPSQAATAPLVAETRAKPPFDQFGRAPTKPAVKGAAAVSSEETVFAPFAEDLAKETHTAPTPKQTARDRVEPSLDARAQPTIAPPEPADEKRAERARTPADEDEDQTHFPEAREETRAEAHATHVTQESERAWPSDPEPRFGQPPASGTGGFAMRGESEMPPYPPMRETLPPWRSPKFWRITGRVAAVVLAITLLLQVLWWQRETVLVYFPHSQSLYASACDQIGCIVTPPRDIDGLQIENSGLRQVDGPHRLELKLSLRNRFDVALAYPALELTLLDEKNNIAIRRVLWPQDYARPGTIFANGLPARSTQPVIVRLDTGEAVAANYRVQVFYP